MDGDKYVHRQELEMIKEFIYQHEPLWLFIILMAGLCVEIHSNYVLRKEYDYDKEKDERKQKRTRTTKKVTTEPDGTIVTQENIETTESKGESDAK